MKLRQQILTYGKRLWTFSQIFFPDREIFARPLPVFTQVIAFAALTAVFMGLGHFLPADGFFAYDWIYAFHGQAQFPAHYPPWTQLIVDHLSWPGLIGVTLAAVCLAIYKRSVHPVSAAFALLTLQVFWTIFDGQLDGLVVLGLLGLPWLTPLALLKPQVSLFAFGARRSYLLGMMVTLAVSLLIWGLWPLRALHAIDTYDQARAVQDIALRWWGLPITLALAWWSRGDMDMLMAAGVFMTPYLVPYNLLPLVPAIARLPPRGAVLAWAFSWLPLAANWLGPSGWWLVWVFVGYIWLSLAVTRYPNGRASRFLQRFTIPNARYKLKKLCPVRDQE